MLQPSLILLLVTVSTLFAHHCWDEKSIDGHDVVPRESKFCFMDWCVTVTGKIDGQTGSVRYCGGMICATIGETCVEKSVYIPVVGEVDGKVCCCKGDRCNNAPFATEAPAPPPTTTPAPHRKGSDLMATLNIGMILLAGLPILHGWY
ncbi:hypothetical protein L596_009920 [Steinernema carpocapsae]|uniref:UPAR/Ly6 domain-containing protein n=1 Tax=Steinernema carpocapsae TaxID=34508 RepID=A0A4U5PGQ5_STECR|nr:hypothetical protein L596_009920 [Steinernema carpocapsae]